MFYLFYTIFLSFIICDDVNIWISSVHDDRIELSIKSNAPIFGFDFKIETSNNEILNIDYSEENFSNGSASESLYMINPGLGIVTNNSFNCFTNGENQLLGLSLGNNFLPATDSTLMMSIPITSNPDHLNYSIQEPYFFTKDLNYNIIDLEVEYGLIEYQSGWPFSDSDKILGAPAIFDINQDYKKNLHYIEKNSTISKFYYSIRFLNRKKLENKYYLGLFDLSFKSFKLCLKQPKMLIFSLLR